MKKAIIIANERKSQINSRIPTVLHKIIDKPMIEKIVDNFKLLDFDDVISIVDYEKERVKSTLSEKCHYFEVSEDVFDFKALKPLIKDEEGITVVTFGNVPLIRKSTFSKMIDTVKDAPMVILVADVNNDYQQDIIMRNPAQTIRSILKYEDATVDQKAIKEVNMNVYAFNNKLLYEYLEILDRECDVYSAVDLVTMFKNDGHVVMPQKLNDPLEGIMIRTRRDLVYANDWERLRVNNYWLDHDVTILDPDSIIIGTDVVIGKDCIIHPNNTILGNSVIGEFNILHSDNHISNSKIGNNNIIERSNVNQSEIEDENNIGPWTNIREGVHIGNHNRLGSGVELKKTTMKDYNALAHNVYLGDTTIGSHTNFGWGVVTANYDGKMKHPTTVGDNSFVGSSSTIIAPVNIGTQVLVAAGSVIKEDIPDGAMGIARSKQENKPGKGKLYIEGKV